MGLVKLGLVQLGLRLGLVSLGLGLGLLRLYFSLGIHQGLVMTILSITVVVLVNPSPAVSDIVLQLTHSKIARYYWH